MEFQEIIESLKRIEALLTQISASLAPGPDRTQIEWKAWQADRQEDKSVSEEWR